MSSTHKAYTIHWPITVGADAMVLVRFLATSKYLNNSQTYTVASTPSWLAWWQAKNLVTHTPFNTICTYCTEHCILVSDTFFAASLPELGNDPGYIPVRWKGSSAASANWWPAAWPPGEPTALQSIAVVSEHTRKLCKRRIKK